MSIEGLVRLANANESVLDDTRDEKVLKMNIDNDTLKFQHEKADKIRDDAETDSLFESLGAIGQGIASIF